MKPTLRLLRQMERELWALAYLVAPNEYVMTLVRGMNPDRITPCELLLLNKIVGFAGNWSWSPKGGFRDDETK